MKIRPPILALLLLLLTYGIDFIFPEIIIVPNPFNLIGIFVLVAGFYIPIISLKLFKSKKTTHNPFGKPDHLVTEGIYKKSRNPMYLGVTLILLGTAIYYGSLAIFIAPIAFFLIINFIYIPREEKILEKLFGNVYLDYKKRVRRWL